MSQDLGLWMTNLAPELRKLPLINLAIPGSHDSFTFGMTSSSDVAPDADPILSILQALSLCIVIEVIKLWSITQVVNLQQQLNTGIRYFDLRIATKENDDLFYAVHGLYSVDINSQLVGLNQFLGLHPEEVVILDCQHFYAFEADDHERFSQLLFNTFGAKLLPYTTDAKSVTLQNMADNQYQVIVIYREQSNLDASFWPSESFPNPWANTMSVPYLITFLTDGLNRRDDSIGFVSQCILTPPASYLLQHFSSNLRNECLIPLEEEKYKWLEEQKVGPGGLNIVISDFVGFEDGEFPRAVIGLNQKLIDKH